MRPSRCVIAARASSVCFCRSPKFWLGLLSTTTTATDGRDSRSSFVSDGLASASAAKASAIARTNAPRLLITMSSTAAMVATASAAHSTWLGTSGENAIPKPKIPLLLSQALKQRRDMHLVGLVVAGQRVHHDVDAGTERELALARLARHRRQHRLAVRALRPGAGEIVRGDQDRRHAVAAARRAFRLVVVRRRSCFNPCLARREAAGKVLQEEERLGQHVIARHRLE